MLKTAVGVVGELGVAISSGLAIDDEFVGGSIGVSAIGIDTDLGKAVREYKT